MTHFSVRQVIGLQRGSGSLFSGENGASLWRAERNAPRARSSQRERRRGGGGGGGLGWEGGGGGGGKGGGGSEGVGGGEGCNYRGAP